MLSNNILCGQDLPNVLIKRKTIAKIQNFKYNVNQ